MAALKKTNTKSKKLPAPATKTVAAPKSAAPAKPVAKKKAAPAASVTPALKAATTGLAAIAVRAVVSPPVTTTVTAKIDVGFGNALYLRGEGPGLNWEKGLRMTCVAADEWQAVLGESSRPFAVKFLINDATWSGGPDFTFASGKNVTFAPEF